MGMDKKIEKKTWTSKKIFGIVGVAGIAALTIYVIYFMDTRSALNVNRSKVTISTVQESAFQEYIQETGTVQPIQTIYLDAIEGGVVQDVYLESGIMVNQGDTILTLTNSDLQLNVLQQEASLYDQINNVRNSRLNLEQTTLRLQEQLANAEYQVDVLRPQFERQKELFNKDMISRQDFEEVKENYEFQVKRYEITYESYKKDSLQTINQLNQLDMSEKRMYRSLTAVQKILDNLIVTAPIAGQLSTTELNQGQSVSRGERIGQIDILDNYKVRVGIDEYHLPRISTGLRGSFDFDGQSHELVITKIYPVINDGQFEVDMEFTGEAPESLRRGQSLRIRLELGESSRALQIPRGGFYKTTGGNWIYVLNENGSKAVRQPIDLGRQNPRFFEVSEGLQPGDRVITSGYETFGNNEVLNLEDS